MAIKITEDCINCDACISKCPNNAIYEPGESWKFSDGTALSGTIPGLNGSDINAEAVHDAISDEFYYIVADKCTECKGFHEEPQCASVCPVDCCVPDESHVETDEVLLRKKDWMHL
jgi:ferredoxin